LGNSKDSQAERDTGDMKKALLIRLGAFGDLVFATPVIKKLKQEGYHVTVNVKKSQSDAVLKNNPNIDKFLYHDDSINNEDLDKHWAELSKGYDKVVNLSGSLEESLLRRESDPRSRDLIHAACNVNYYDHTMQWAGYEGQGDTGEFYFTPLEIQEAKRFRKKYKDKFLVLWSMSGSSFHKVYPYTTHVMRGLVAKYPDIVFMVTGDAFCEIFEQDLSHERIKNYINKWTMRKTMLMTKFVDLVAGPETGVLVAAGCFDTPKVIFLSHSSEENLTKYWRNVDALRAYGVSCQPCHRLIYNRNYCPLDPGLEIPMCMAKIPLVLVFKTIEDRYKEKKYGLLPRVR